MITPAGIHHFALSVANPPASIQWYTDWLGFRLERQFSLPEQQVEIAHLCTPTKTVRLELLWQHDSIPSPDYGKDAFGAIATQGAKHLGLLVGDIAAVHEEMMRRGAVILHELAEVKPAGVRNFWMLDNSGNHIEFVEPL